MNGGVNMKYLMGLDGGNTSVKAVIFNEKGETIASARSKAFRFESRGKGFAEFGVDELGDLAYSCIREAIYKANIDTKDIIGIGVTSFGNGLVVLDKDGNSIAPGAFSQDYRATDIVEKYKADGILDRINEITKGSVFAGEPGPILRWFKEYEPHVYEKIGSILMFKDYIVYRLTGVISTDANNFGGSNMLHTETLEYSKELLELYGIPEMYDKLPKLAIKPTEIVGIVTEEASMKTGLSAGTPVVAGMMDVFACLIGAGATGEGVLTAVGGSWSINLAHSNRLIPNASANMPYLRKGEYLHASWSGASGSNYEWFTKVLAGEAKLQAGEKGDFFKVLDELVASVDIKKVNVFFHPFAAQPSVHTEAKANIFNADLNTTFAEIAYAVAEGIAFIHKYHMDFLRSYVNAKKVRFTGGTARSRVIGQIFANVLELPVEVVDCEEVGALGCAITAGVATGVYKDFDDAFEKAVKVLPVINPNPETFKTYHRRYKEWTLLVEVMTAYWDKKKQIEAKAQEPTTV